MRDIAAVAAHILKKPAPDADKAYTLTGGESLMDTQRAAELSFMQFAKERAQSWE